MEGNSKMTSLHIEIAQVLIECAKNQTTVCYSELMRKFRIPRKNIGAELETLSLFTYEKHGIFLSALVVRKDERKYPLPGPGFFRMYCRVCGETDMCERTIVQAQREKIYAEDWSDLIGKMQEVLNRD